MKFDSSYNLLDYDQFKAHSFFCMGGLCEVLVETKDKDLSNIIFNEVYKEAKRLESKFSRYRTDNIVYKINNAHGKPVKIDKETFRLLQFSNSLYKASDGLFDITSGVLRRAWNFDGKSNVPNTSEINSLLELIGWDKVRFDKKSLSLPKHWELDFGGVGKEYAVDSCCEKAKSISNTAALINLGGDISVTGPKNNQEPWLIEVDQSQKKIYLLEGGVATSGDKNRFVIHNGKRLSHILNPRTGWPIEDAPKSVTVIAQTCAEAGALSTLGSLMGNKCEEFLESEAEDFNVVR